MLFSSCNERPVPPHHQPSPTTNCLINIEPAFKNSQNCPSIKYPRPCTFIGSCTFSLKCCNVSFTWIFYELRTFQDHPIIFTSVISGPTTVPEGFKEVSCVRWWLNGSQSIGPHNPRPWTNVPGQL